MTLTPGRKSIEEMREILAGVRNDSLLVTPEDDSNNEEEGGESSCNSRDEAAKAILQKSFLPHQKGQAREYCSLGHMLELPILHNCIQVVTGEESPVIGLEVKGAYTTGLAAKKGSPHAKDSIDFVITVTELDDPDEVKAWGFEAKGRVTARTAAAEERNLRYLSHPHVRIHEFDVHEEVANEGERFQVLHHAFVYDFDVVVLAIGDDQSSLIRSTIIDFSIDLKEQFGEVIDELKRISLEWAYPDNPAALSSTITNRRAPKVITVPQRILNLAKDIKTINGSDTLQGTANIWRSLVLLPKPFPSFLRFIPAVYAFWNVVKGGSDTTSKLMDDCILRVPKAHMNTETVAINRLLSLVFVLIHHLNQTITAQDNLNSYSSLLNYQISASKKA
mmetsp:Transcript_12022/g.14908  ORF Transcript_12022/g.14908 Transcript_12022/m.14908 type:complete len:391 (-) Transcript_12022:1073-2245(-)